MSKEQYEMYWEGADTTIIMTPKDQGEYERMTRLLKIFGFKYRTNQSLVAILRMYRK